MVASVSAILPILSLVGPTATGKSALAYQLAAEWLAFKVKPLLISVDSRQVYQGLELISGVDLPPAELGPLVGVSTVLPNEPWSVGHFCQLVRPLLVTAAVHQQPVILVGGTGLYHQQLFSTDTALITPPNQELRLEWADAELADLQRVVQQRNPNRWVTMNPSDRANARRLIRALELSSEVQEQTVPLPPLPPYRLLTVGLEAEVEVLTERIKSRVHQRFAFGAIQEVERLIANYTDWSLPAFSTTGVREVRQYIEGTLTAEECMEIWTRREVQYAKRQVTWWKKNRPQLSIELAQVTELVNRLRTFPDEQFSL